jgi:hypothetical protein
MRYSALIVLLTAVSFRQTYTYSTLYSFGPTIADGETLVSGLIMNSKGNLYRTTQYGGYQSGQCNQGGCGTVFELRPKR